MASPTPTVKSAAGDNEAANHESLNSEELEQITGTSQSKLKNADAGGGDGDDFDVWVKSRLLLKPEDQLDLAEAELAEEVTKVLTPTNTNVLENLVVYSFKRQGYVPLPPEGNTVSLFKLEGTALHVESEEARIQMEEEGDMGYPLPAPRTSFIDDIEPVQKSRKSQRDEETQRDEEEHEAEAEQEEVAEEEKIEGEDGEEEQEGEEAEDAQEGQQDDQTDAIAIPVYGKKRKLINQFNFCERAALTYSNPKRNVFTQTIPPPRSQYGNTVLQWTIYDSYAQDFFEQQKLEKSAHDKRLSSYPGARQEPPAQPSKTLVAELLNKKYLKCWQILERMINQNIFDEVANDYRYWEDPADEYREGEGTLLPLWKFQYDRVKKMHVTDVVFNPQYYDLFGVCYGSHEFMKQSVEGCVCFFTIKNPSYPDYIIMTPSGVMCCDIHPKYPYLAAIGMYDGNVAVYNLRENLQKPLYNSVGINSKHAECVWEIKWGLDMADGEINFYSISSSGHVYNWILMQNRLSITTIITLFMENGVVEGPDGTELRMKSCGSCMSFHPTDREIFLVGTEEGLIYKCSTAYSSKYLMTYTGHHLSVYRIDYNRFNANIFISCSGDWRIKVWEDMRAEPLFIFDLGASVGDVRWAPFSSTVFAAVTLDGKVYVFDLNINKYRAICVQSVVPKRKSKLTRIAFNGKLPFIIVGDDKGTINSLKLSPNLRMMVKPPKKQLYLDQNTLQVTKLEKLLSLVRELPEGPIIKDTTTTVQS